MRIFCLSLFQLVNLLSKQFNAFKDRTFLGVGGGGGGGEGLVPSTVTCTGKGVKI